MEIDIAQKHGIGPTLEQRSREAKRAFEEVARTADVVAGSVLGLSYGLLQLRAAITIEASFHLPQGTTYLLEGKRLVGHPTTLGKQLARAWYHANHAQLDLETRALVKAAGLRVREGHKHAFVSEGRYGARRCSCGVERGRIR